MQLSEFDISVKTASISFLIIIVVWASFSFEELFTPECEGIGACFDYDRRMARLAVWDIQWYSEDARHFVHFFLLKISDLVFGNPKVLPLVSSGFILFLTFLITTNLTKNRLAGLASSLVLTGSYIFYNYDTSVTYPSFWTAFFLFAVYLSLGSHPKSSIIPFIIAIPAKAVVALYLPALLLFMGLTGLKRKSTILLYCIAGGVGACALVLSSTIGDGLKGGFLLFDRVDPLAFAVGLWDWTKLFNDDVITFYLLIFVIAVLIAIRKKPNAMAVLAMIIGLIMVHPVLLGFTGYDSWDYRFLPVVCFVSIGFGFFIKYYPEVIEKFKALGKSAKSSSSYHVDDEQSKANSI